MEASTQVIKRSLAFNAATAFESPMDAMDLYSPFIPAPHLESFLEELNTLNPTLIESDFIASLFSVSTEDIVPNDQQIIYAKMCAFGFATNPDRFTEVIELVRTTDNTISFRTKTKFNAVFDRLNTATAAARSIFGMSNDVAVALSSAQVLPVARLIRLAQIGILTTKSLGVAEQTQSSLTFYRSALGQHSNLFVSDCTVEYDNALRELAANDTVLTMLKFTPNVQLVIDAVVAGTTLGELIVALRDTRATPETILVSKTSKVDNSLIESLMNEF